MREKSWIVDNLRQIDILFEQLIRHRPIVEGFFFLLHLNSIEVYTTVIVMYASGHETLVFKNC